MPVLCGPQPDLPRARSMAFATLKMCLVRAAISAVPCHDEHAVLKKQWMLGTTPVMRDLEIHLLIGGPTAVREFGAGAGDQGNKSAG